MLRVSSLGLRCFRRPLQATTLRWHSLSTRDMSHSTVRTMPKEPPQDRRPVGHQALVPPRTSWTSEDALATFQADVEGEFAAKAPFCTSESRREERRSGRFLGNRNPRPIPPLAGFLFKPTCDLPQLCRSGDPRKVELAMRLQAGKGSRPMLDRTNKRVAASGDQEGPHNAYVPRTDSNDRPPLTGNVDIEEGGGDIKLDGLKHLCLPCSHRKFLHILATTTSTHKAWLSYQHLLNVPREGTRLSIPWEHLHRLTRLIVTSRPRIHNGLCYNRLLSVMRTIVETGGTLQLWQWNALIDHAGKGWRKTTLDAFEAALTIYADLRLNRPPGSSLSQSRNSHEPVSFRSTTSSKLQPDAVTMATLLNLASRTGHDTTFRRAIAIFRSSGVQPSREIYLTLLSHHLRRDDLHSFRAILSEMLRQGHELIGLDLLNACLWMFARDGRLDVAEHIFIALKGNMSPRACREASASRNFLDAMGLPLPTDVRPDRITYTTMIQAHAYIGNLRECLTIFIDMVNALAPAVTGKTAKGPTAEVDMNLVLAAYRAMFLGFARHAQVPRVSSQFTIVSQSVSLLRRNREPSHDGHALKWDLHALQQIFQDFLTLSHKITPNDRLLYWLLIAFERTSGNDVRVMREVRTQLEGRFDIRWRGRLGNFARI